VKKSPQVKAPVDEDDPLDRDMSDFVSKAKWRRVRFVFAPKDSTVTIRIPRTVVDLAKQVAKKKGIKYHKMMRDAIVDYVVKAA
jgi:predicted DNA binding CopG/RHH family protein